MRTAAKFLWMACLALVAVGCTQPETVESRLVKAETLARADLHYYWQLSLNLEGGETLTRLYLMDENLYGITSANRVIAIEAATGLRKWSRVIADPEENLFPPCHADGAMLPPKPILPDLMRRDRMIERRRYDLVCFNTLRRALVMDRADGEILRDLPLSAAANTGGACDGAYFYYTSTEGLYHAISLDEAVQVWTFGMGDMISAAPQAHSQLLFVAADNGRVTATVPTGVGRRLWDVTLSGPVVANFVADDRGLFIPCENSRIYAMELGTGQPLWEPFICNGPLRTPVQVGENSLFQYATDDRFYAVNIASGAQRWTNNAARTVLASMGQDICLRDAGNRLLVINEFVGSVKHIVPLTGLTLFAPNAKAPAIYAATADGHIVCIRSREAGRLTPDMLSYATE